MGPIWGWHDPGGPHELCYLGYHAMNQMRPQCIQTFFKVKFERHCQSPRKPIGTLTKVFCTSGSNLVILARKGDESWHGQTRRWYTETNRQMQEKDNIRRPKLAWDKNQVLFYPTREATSLTRPLEKVTFFERCIWFQNLTLKIASRVDSVRLHCLWKDNGTPERGAWHVSAEYSMSTPLKYTSHRNSNSSAGEEYDLALTLVTLLWAGPQNSWLQRWSSQPRIFLRHPETWSDWKNKSWAKINIVIQYIAWYCCALFCCGYISSF